MPGMGGAPPAPTQAPAAPSGVPSGAGLRGKALLGALSARKVLEMSAPHLGVGTPEGKAVYDAIKALAKIDVQAAPGLTQSEGQSIQEAVRPVQTAGPQQMGGPMPGPGSQPG